MLESSLFRGIANAASAALAALYLGASPAYAATAMGQIRLTADMGAKDLGMAPDTQFHSVTLALKVPNRAALEAFIASTIDPRSPNYHKFLTPAQFAATYGQSPDAVARVTNYLQSYGITVSKVFKNNLLITFKANNAQLATAFGSPIHVFSLKGQTFQRPLAAVGVPAALSDVVASVVGLSTQAVFRPHNMRLPKGLISASSAAPHRNPACGDPNATCGPTAAYPATETPGDFTTADVAEQYNIGPVYKRGLSGSGTTIAVLTLAGMFNPEEPYQYWSDMGLKVARARITEIAVDGGSGSDDVGQFETTIDVEQAGGVAPQARILVYEAPNTAGGWLDLFAQAVEDNQADLMTTSWGSAEIAQDPAILAAQDISFLQAAAQGIPLVAASGDSGAFDINSFGTATDYPDCTTTLTVDFPASHPYVLAAGGTTRPMDVLVGFTTTGGTVTPINIKVPVERPWAWDYFMNWDVTMFGQAAYFQNTFPAGGGGGVSVRFAAPAYQGGLTGTKTTAAGQSLFCKSGSTMIDEADLPVGFAGRNVPDISLNADPTSGFWVFGGGVYVERAGGTSFVAPQLAGIFALLSQQAGHRLGFLNPQIYSMFKRYGYGTGSPFKPITSGDNQFYKATNPPSYNPASGIGTLNVDNLAKAFATP